MFLVFFLLLWSVCVNAQFNILFEGDSCTSNAGSGTCRLLKDCPAAVTRLQKGIQPKHCGFKKHEPIVCCEQTFIQHIKTDRTPGETSIKQCEFYKRYVVYAVFNGDPVANRFEYPHMAAIGFQDEGDSEIRWGCGGAIISDSFILTAAHCITNIQLGPPKYVMYGMVDLGNDKERVIVNVSQIIVHPDYNPPANYHDIGLLRVEPKIFLGGWSRPACLYTSRDILDKRATVTGFGRTGLTGPSSQILLRVTLDLFNQSDCDQVYGDGSEKAPQGIDHELMICAGSYKELKDTCKGDSGGPLVVVDRKSFPNMIQVIGVVSFGKPCGQVVKWPGVYTRVSAYVKWIEDIVWPEE